MHRDAIFQIDWEIMTEKMNELTAEPSVKPTFTGKGYVVPLVIGC